MSEKTPNPDPQTPPVDREESKPEKLQKEIAIKLSELRKRSRGENTERVTSQSLKLEKNKALLEHIKATYRTFLRNEAKSKEEIAVFLRRAKRLEEIVIILQEAIAGTFPVDDYEAVLSIVSAIITDTTTPAEKQFITTKPKLIAKALKELENEGFFRT